MTPEKENMNSNPHGGHRQRMRKKVLDGGASKLSERELIEMLLYYILPRCDTNRQADELLKKFGSLEGVLNAEKGALSSVSGLKDGAEVLFMLLRELLERYGNKKTDISVLEPELIKKRISEIYRNIENETVFALYFAPDGKFIEEQLVFRGGISSAKFSLRTVTEGAIRAGGSSVVLAHNHPSGKLIPSGDDVISTKRIAAHLAANDIELLEHYIVTKDGCVGIMNVD